MSTKAYLISNLATSLGITKKAAGNVYTTLSQITHKSLGEHGAAIVPGIGRLKLKTKGPRMGRNPKTGELIPIDERRVLKLSTSKLAKIRINIGVGN